jgi:hypothetical protein
MSRPYARDRYESRNCVRLNTLRACAYPKRFKPQEAETVS